MYRTVFENRGAPSARRNRLIRCDDARAARARTASQRKPPVLSDSVSMSTVLNAGVPAHKKLGANE